MLISSGLAVLVNLLGAIFTVTNAVVGLGASGVRALPYGVDALLVSLFGSWFGFLNVFWPLADAWPFYVSFMTIVFVLWVLKLVRVIR